MLNKLILISISTLLLINVSCKKDDENIEDNSTQVEVLSGVISSNRHLVKNTNGLSPDYFVSGILEINNNAVLTVDSGVVIKFKSGAGILINEGAGLNAIGTVNKPIVFTGEQPTNGYWGGLYFIDSDNINNQLNYCVIEYGGKDSYLYDEGNIVIGSNDYGMARVAINNSTIRRSLKCGISVSKNSFLTDFSHNNITLNTEEPIILEPMSYFDLDTTNSYNGNGKDYIKIPNQYSYYTTFAIVFPSINVPYYISGNLNLGAGLDISAGVRIIMGQGSEIDVNGKFGKAGYFNAVGTATDSIIITGMQPTPGYWNRIMFSSLDVKNEFKYCRVEYGGKTGNTLDENALIAMYSLSDQASIKITNSRLQNSLSYGLFLLQGFNYNSDISTANTYSNNISGNIFIKP